MSDLIKAEIALKREKLLAYREMRKQRDEERRRAQELKEADEILAGLGIAIPIGLPSSASTSRVSGQASPNDATTNSVNSVTSTPKTLAEKKPVLTVVNVYKANIPPKEQVTYSKQTQTTTTSEREDVNDDDSFSLPTTEVSLLDEPPASRPPGTWLVELVKPAITLAEREAASKILVEENQPPKPVEMSDEQKCKVMLTDGFARFFDRSSRFIERALAEDFSDIFIDYSGVDGDDKETDKLGTRLSMNRNFYDERWCKGRMVTALDWSAHFPELVMASYDTCKDFCNDPDGMALIWNLKFNKPSPEYIFHCQSAVTSATFVSFHPNLVIGGTYSGQIVLWDNRVNKRTPVQRSPLSSQTHTHPIYCMKVVGTQNAHNLVSISTNGTFCSWSLDMLSQPHELIELHYKQFKVVAPTALSFPVEEVNNFIFGSEECRVYSACRHGIRAGVTGVFKGHQGPVTAVNTHEAQGQIDFSHLFLTSSFDWTVKLWSLKENKPLYSFEDYGDYVTDVGWSPIHPALFASVDGTGLLSVWNLNNDSETATSTAVVDGSPALSKVSWSQSGHQLAVGDRQGKLWVYDVGDQLSTPKVNEWTQLTHTLHKFEDDQADKNLNIFRDSSRRKHGRPEISSNMFVDKI